MLRRNISIPDDEDDPRSENVFFIMNCQSESKQMVVVLVVIDNMLGEPIVLVDGVLHVENIVDGSSQDFNFAHSLPSLIIHRDGSPQLQKGRIDRLHSPSLPSVPLGDEVCGLLTVGDMFVGGFLLTFLLSPPPARTLRTSDLLLLLLLLQDQI